MLPIVLVGALNGPGSEPTNRSGRRFLPVPASVPAARSFVLSVGWSNEDDLNFRLAMLVSEIVTNAVLHARTPFEVSVEPKAEKIRVAISDQSTAIPVKRSYETTHPTGRGLHIVEATADRWGVSPSANGKTIWFELDRVSASV